jgi:tagatose 1,6-diphosphate aldolase
MRTEFSFIDPGPARDGELSVVLTDAVIDGDVPTYRFAIRVDGIAGAVGRVTLRPQTTPHIESVRGHIGYAVDPDHRGHGYAARAVRLVLPLACRHGINPVWITCEPSNLASRRTCEILGAVLTDIVPIPPDDPAYAQGQRQKCRYSLSAAAVGREM